MSRLALTWALLSTVLVASPVAAQQPAPPPSPSNETQTLAPLDTPAATPQLAPVLTPSVVAGQYVPPSLAPPPTPLAPAGAYTSHAELRAAYRGRWLLANGSALVLGSAIAVALGGRSRYCSYQDVTIDRTVTRTFGGVFGAVGLTLITVGAVRVADGTRDPYVSRARKTGMALSSLGLAMVSSLLIGAASFLETAPCWSS